MRCKISGRSPEALSPSAEIEAKSWNEKHPVGTRVRFWRLIREGDGELGTTRAPADVRQGSAVIWVEGLAGCIFLRNVEVAL